MQKDEKSVVGALIDQKQMQVYSLQEQLQKGQERIRELEKNHSEVVQRQLNAASLCSSMKIENDQLKADLASAKAHSEVMEHKASRLNEMLRSKDKDLAEAEKVIEFYAFGNLDERKCVEFCSPKDMDLNDPEIGMFIDWSDVSSTNLPKKYIMMTTGKLAREYLAKRGKNG